MDESAIERTLTECETTLARPGKVDLGALGFWKAVAAVKRRPDLVPRYADRIGRVDRDAFVRAVRPLVFPAALGVTLEAIGTVLGIALVAAAPSLPAGIAAASGGPVPPAGAAGGPGATLPWREIAYVAGAGVLIGATHGLAHWLVGGAAGIRFTHWYSRPPRSPQPGFKTDYATYLRAPARSRAWMHASGAMVSKVIPFVVAALAASGGAQAWAVAVLLAIGVLQLVTDVAFSVRASDWKKFRREMRFA